MIPFCWIKYLATRASGKLELCRGAASCAPAIFLCAPWCCVSFDIDTLASLDRHVKLPLIAIVPGTRYNYSHLTTTNASSTGAGNIRPIDTQRESIAWVTTAKKEENTTRKSSNHKALQDRLQKSHGLQRVTGGLCPRPSSITISSTQRCYISDKCWMTWDSQGQYISDFTAWGNKIKTDHSPDSLSR